jgi:hypothetical protein
MDDNSDKKESSSLLFSQQISKEKLAFLKIGSSFTNNKEDQETLKKKAADYFDISDDENKNKLDKQEKKMIEEYNDEISDFSDSGRKVNDISIIKRNKIKTFKIKEKENKSDRIAKQYILSK